MFDGIGSPHRAQALTLRIFEHAREQHCFTLLIVVLHLAPVSSSALAAQGLWSEEVPIVISLAPNLIVHDLFSVKLHVVVSQMHILCSLAILKNVKVLLHSVHSLQEGHVVVN